MPTGTTTVVVSRGDDDLLQLGGGPAWHFPRLGDGRYAGEYPVDSAEAISHLEDLRLQGADYLVLPSTTFWWLDYYDGLRRHLEDHCETVFSNGDCRIYRLLEGGSCVADTPLARVAHVPRVTVAEGRMLSNFLDSLVLSGAHLAVAAAATTRLPLGAEAWQPTQAAVVDVVAAERELAALAAEGVEFFVVPKAALEWLRAHPALRETLRHGHRLVTRQEHICEVYELRSAQGEQLSPIVPATATTSERPTRSLLERLGARGRGSRRVDARRP